MNNANKTEEKLMKQKSSESMGNTFKPLDVCFTIFLQFTKIDILTFNRNIKNLKPIKRFITNRFEHKIDEKML